MIELSLLTVATVCVVIRTYIEIQKFRRKD